jgi:prepilin-type N-terminal cleavage/methylation domain-containing protein
MTIQQHHRAARRGFTLIELVIVIAVIAVLAALLVPMILNQTSRARLAAAKESVNEAAKTMKRFHEDTSFWPYGASIWVGQNGLSAQVDPTTFTTNDIALTQSVPPATIGSIPPLLSCKTAVPGTPCWGGPYFSRGTSMGDPLNYDPWGNPLYFMYIVAQATGNGGNASAPSGVAAVWSLGPDQLDGIGCTSNAHGSAGCAVNYANISAGNCSGVTCDDLLAIAGSTI